MRPVDAVSFDLDATLLDGSRFGESIGQTCAWLAARVDGLDATSLLAANRRVWTTLYGEVERPFLVGETDGRTIGLEAWRRTLAACGIVDDAIARMAAGQHWAFGRATHRLFDDVAPVLAALRRARIPVGIVTNGASDTQRDKIVALGLDALIDVVVVSGEVRAAKPEAAPFRTVVAGLGVDPGRVCHVGDNLAADVAGANDAGLISVWLNRVSATRGASDPEPHVEITSLDALAEWLGVDTHASR